MIIIADSHNLFRELLEKHLRDLGYNVQDGVSNARDLINVCSETSIEIIISCLKFSQDDGFYICKKLREIKYGGKIVILTQYYEISIIEYLLQFGINSFLPKEISLTDFTNYIQIVIEEGYFFLPRELSSLNKFVRKNSKTPILGANCGLSIREVEILNLMADGYTNQEIGLQIFVSSRTVEKYRKNLIDKLKVKNSLELIKKGFELGLIIPKQI